ncbi:hypothetical protein B4064_3531 [Caldibacillus thermoamylovorans]|nr:hypothetical protein B4064_3531 [Caldibacillus thermoamylovorans]
MESFLTRKYVNNVWTKFCWKNGLDNKEVIATEFQHLKQKEGGTKPSK